MRFNSTDRHTQELETITMLARKGRRAYERQPQKWSWSRWRIGWCQFGGFGKTQWMILGLIWELHGSLRDLSGSQVGDLGEHFVLRWLSFGAERRLCGLRWSLLPGDCRVV